MAGFSGCGDDDAVALEVAAWLAFIIPAAINPRNAHTKTARSSMMAPCSQSHIFLSTDAAQAASVVHSQGWIAFLVSVYMERLPIATRCEAIGYPIFTSITCSRSSYKQLPDAVPCNRIFLSAGMASG